MAVWGPQRDAEVRTAAMAYIDRVTEQSGGAITRAQLEAFTFDGHNIKLIDHSRGIRNPAILPATLSILTNPPPATPTRSAPTASRATASATATGPKATTASSTQPSNPKSRSSGCKPSHRAASPPWRLCT